MGERPSLRRDLFAAIDDTITPMLNRRLGVGLPQLRWSVGGEVNTDPVWNGQASAGDYDETEARRVVEQWAESFDCETQEANGMVEFRCWTRDVYIVVWGVVDRELFQKGRLSIG